MNTNKNGSYKEKVKIYRRHVLKGASGIEHSFDYFICSDKTKIVADFSDGDISRDIMKLILKSYDTGIGNRILIVKEDVDDESLKIFDKNLVRIMKYSEFLERFNIKKCKTEGEAV